MRIIYKVRGDILLIILTGEDCGTIPIIRTAMGFMPADGVLVEA
jgi:hypothetical protein